MRGMNGLGLTSHAPPALAHWTAQLMKNLINQVIMIAYVYGGKKPADIYRLYYHFKPLAWTKAWLRARLGFSE